MILEYHRPQTLEEALLLLQRPQPLTLPMGGGTVLNKPSDDDFAVVDLQALELDGMELRGNIFEVGSATKLQVFMDAQATPNGLKAAIRHEAAYNLRHMASVAGTLVAADGRSPFATAMLALDANLVWLPGEERTSLADMFFARGQASRGKLISKVEIPINMKLAYEYVARTPADQPIVCAALASWPSGRTRLALGGFGKAPVLAMDGPEAGGLEAAAASAYADAGDEWASAEYRQEIAGVLAKRCLAGLGY